MSINLKTISLATNQLYFYPQIFLKSHKEIATVSRDGTIALSWLSAGAGSLSYPETGLEKKQPLDRKLL